MTQTTLSTQAIDAALRQNWKEAIDINTSILKFNKNDIDALCRLGYAYIKTGQFPQAKNTYTKVLKIDEYNQIAIKNIKRIPSMKKKDVVDAASSTQVSPLVFLEEPGKTKIVDCIHLAPSQIISSLSAGQEVYLNAKNHCVEIRSAKNTYLAALPDDLSFRLIKLMTSGNKYQSIVKSVDKKTLKILIRELSRGKRFAHQPTFIGQPHIGTSLHQPITKRDKPDMTPTGEEEEDTKEPNATKKTATEDE